MLYIDGFPAGRSSTVVALPSEVEPTQQAWLGRSLYPGDPGLHGLMDDFRIYNRKLSSTEIADLAWPDSDYSSWRFDENTGTTASDSSDNALDATLEGGASWTAGRLNSAVSLSGTDQYVSFADNPIADCTTELTISVWVNSGAFDYWDGWSRILDFGNGFINPDRDVSAGAFLTPLGLDGHITFSLKAPGDPNELFMVANSGVPADGAWHHVAVVVSETEARIQLDGINVFYAEYATWPWAWVLPGELGALTQNRLGRSAYYPADADLHGSLDELRISCRAYTYDEVRSLAFQ